MIIAKIWGLLVLAWALLILGATYRDFASGVGVSGETLAGTAVFVTLSSAFLAVLLMPVAHAYRSHGWRALVLFAALVAIGELLHFTSPTSAGSISPIG